ncbi:exopolysaccharide biosynthesis protein [Arhodomonas sp. AD133]|uniref:exopolysaccharide biosynthesis protein n=1 Tax=Arhodomonas sp. AD133 TaxID=3415009 RepID=UPI003EBACB78
MGLTDILDELAGELDGKHITIGDVVAVFQSRGFGPLLLAPALIALLPTGAVPGVPTVCATLVVLTAAQLVLGRRSPWLPSRLSRVALARERFLAVYNRARPVTRRIDGLTGQRLGILTNGPAPRLVAALCLLLALTMVPLELVPFAAAVPAAAIVLLALGLSVRDGLLVLIGILAAVAGAFGLGWWIA